jgi:hypothetical protein
VTQFWNRGAICTEVTYFDKDILLFRLQIQFHIPSVWMSSVFHPEGLILFTKALLLLSDLLYFTQRFIALLTED